MLSKGKAGSIMTPFKIKHHMVCLNLLQQEKSPHFAKINEIQVWMQLCSLVQKETKVSSELQSTGCSPGSPARPDHRQQRDEHQPTAPCQQHLAFLLCLCHHQIGVGVMK